MSTNRIGAPPGPPPGGDRMFQRLDTSGDGQLDDQELSAFAQKISERTGQSVSVAELKQKLDTNGDGKVSKQELEKGRPPPPPFDQSQFIGQGEGTPLSQEALQALAQHASQRSGTNVSVEDLLAKLDQNGDGQLTGEELRAQRRNLGDEVNQRRQALRMRS